MCNDVYIEHCFKIMQRGNRQIEARSHFTSKFILINGCTK